MAIVYGNSQITSLTVSNNLVVNFNANDPSSYSGSGNTWSDISGSGYSATLFNSPEFLTEGSAKYFAFNGINQYATTTYVQPIYTISSTITWNAWVRSKINQDPPIIGNRGGAELRFIKLTSNKFEYYPSSSFSPLFVAQSYPLEPNTWKNICIVINNGTIKYFKNSILVESKSYSSFSTQTIPFFIGGDQTANEYANVDISQIMIYDKELSQKEIVQNYFATKGIYGL